MNRNAVKILSSEICIPNAACMQHANGKKPLAGPTGKFIGLMVPQREFQPTNPSEARRRAQIFQSGACV